MKKILVMAVLLTLVSLTFAQENISTQGEAGLGRAPLPEAYYDTSSAAGTYGLKVNLGWANVDWSIGDINGSDQLFAPQLSLFYKVTKNLDINISTFFLSADDTNGELGATTADISRFSLGARYWVETKKQIMPYFGAGLGYYMLDMNVENVYENGAVVPASVSVSDSPGAYFEGGLAFLISESFLIDFDFTYDLLLGSSKGTINDVDSSIDMTSLSFNMGMTLMF